MLTFSHEIIRTGKGALGGREGERRRVELATSTGFQERNLKHGEKSKHIVGVGKWMGLRKGRGSGKKPALMGRKFWVFGAFGKEQGPYRELNV